MRARLSAFWENVRSSLWFVPSVMAIVALVLSFVTVEVDQHVNVEWVRAVGWLWAGGVEGARAVLSTIAGSIMTVAGVTFSITITALTLASSQFGPRLLRNFMSDRGNQFVLGTFIATFLYCLLVLRTVRGVEESRFIPYISVSVGMLLALLSMAVLIYFIHHMAESIQADNLSSSVAEELHHSINRLFPEKLGHAEHEASEAKENLPEGAFEESYHVEARHSGYVQSIDNERLLQLARDHDVLICLYHQPGHFVGSGHVLAKVAPPERCNEKLADALHNVFVIGRNRTSMQDAEFSMNQLVEIAVRALSPGINDPHTALNCIDWLSDALTHLAGREMPAQNRYDEDGKLRIVLDEPITFEKFANSAWNQIRHYGASSVEVTRRLLQTIATIGNQAIRESDFDVLRHHADLIASDGAAQATNEHDRIQIKLQHAETLRLLAERSRQNKSRACE